MDLQAVILLGAFVESTVQWFKAEYRDKFTYLSLFISLCIVWAVQLNFLILIGFKDVTPFGVVGMVMMAMVLARGANFINDLMSSFKY